MAAIELSRDALAYEAIQRTYREMMIGHIRDRLTDHYGHGAIDRLRRPFKAEQWTEIEAAAALARSAGAVSSRARDAFDMLDVAMFHNVIDAEFDLLFPGAPDEPPRDKAARREGIVRFARTVKSVRDPISHPVTEEMDLRDARMCIDSARRIALLVDAKAEVRLSELLEALDATPRLVEPLEAVLPPLDIPGGGFIGRRRELGELEAWLAGSDSRRWLIAGGGGRGKTAIANQFARDVRDNGTAPFELVLWMTAKRRSFVEGQTKELTSPDFSDLPSAIDRILDAFGWLTDAPIELGDRRAFALQLLRELPALVIADDVDSLEVEDEAVTEFLAQVAYSTPSKVLMTSRRQLMGMGASCTVVQGLERSDAETFLVSRVERFGLDPAAFTEDKRRKILEVTDRIPLFVEDLLRLCLSGMAVDEATRTWRDRGGERAREFALGREADLLTADAVEVLLAATLQDQAVSFEELRLVTGKATDDLVSAIGELQRLFLVPRPRLIESVERFELDTNTRTLVREVLVPRYPDTTKRLRSVLDELTGDVSQAALRHRRVGEFVRQAVFLVSADRHLEAEATLEAGLHEYPDDRTLLGYSAWVYKSWKPSPRTTDARARFERARDLGSTDSQMFRHWVEMERALEQWSVASAVADLGLERAGDDQTLRYQAGYAHLQLARQMGQRREKATIDEVRKAINHLRIAILDPEKLTNYRARLTNSKAYRALCYALYEEMVQLRARRGPADESRIRYLGDELIRSVQRWQAEHPDDTYAEDMAARLMHWRIERSGDQSDASAESTG